MMDRISSLPDEVVCHILSLLSTKEAALTSPLSKRWRNLFVFSSKLCFKNEAKDNVSENSEREITTSFTNFVDRVLAVSSNCLIKQFTLTCRDNALPDQIKRWISTVLSRGVRDLHLDLNWRMWYSLPLEVFSCNTIVTLKLQSALCNAIVLKNASLPALKSLSLHHLRFYYHQGLCSFKALISACPILEELVMVDTGSRDRVIRKWYLTLSCPTLKRFTLKCNRHNLVPFKRSITFDTPRLAYLHYYGYVPQEYPSVHFDSLVQAKLSLKSSPYAIQSNPTNMIKGLRNAEILDLSPHKTSMIIYNHKEAIPVFKKLYHLSITTESNNCWQILPVLLKNSPNLETLVIKGPLHYDENGEEPESSSECLSGYSCLCSCPVKVLKIILDRETILKMNQLKHFLEKLTCLELVKVCYCATDQQEQLQLTKDLLSLPRSSNCKIQVEFVRIC